MSFKLIGLVFLVHFYGCDCVRVYLSKCINEFNCVTDKVTKQVAVTYECRKETPDVTIFINQFNSPNLIESFTIRNCENLTISTRCTGEKKNIQKLLIANVKNLYISKNQYTSHVPPLLHLENISYVEAIPSFSFSQIDKEIHSIGCVIPKMDFSTLIMRNVSIDTIQPNGFYMPNDFGNVTMDRVRINRMQNSAFKVKMRKDSVFKLEKSNIEIVEHLAFQIESKDVLFNHNQFIDISASSINGTIENFYFTNNSVNTLHASAISILSKNVFVESNRIEYMKSGALEKISPGLMDVLGKNFGQLKFTFIFDANTVYLMDAGCLHPDIVAYESVASHISFAKNKFHCTCENIGWLFSEIGHGSNTLANENIYDMLLDKASENICSNPCQTRIGSLKYNINDGKCSENLMEQLCDVKSITTTKSTSTVKVKEFFMKKPKTMMIRSSGERSLDIQFLVSLIVFIVIIC